jgi:acetolactate synthase-1/2/3 large subunit
MAKKTKVKPEDRRRFLKTAAASAALAVTKPATGKAQEIAQAPQITRNASAPVLGRPAAAPATIAVDEAKTIDKPGSDFMVDVIKSLGFEYMFGVPANTYMSLQESIVNYGKNKDPEFILATNEDLAAAMAHGYAKISGRPALVGCHGTVGAQHATMGVYDAFCDRVPMVMILGNIFDAARRGASKVQWAHSANDAAALVRDMTKWDDAPHSLSHFAESMVRAYKIAVTPPMMPTAIVLDVDLQEEEVPRDANLHIPKMGTLVPPTADPAAVNERSREVARCGRAPGHRGGSCGAHARGHQASRRACGNAASGCRRSQRTNELPEPASSRADTQQHGTGKCGRSARN